MLSAYALLEDGRPVLLHLDVGPRESYDAWLSFLQDLVGRGLRDPLLVIMDGAPGLVKAVKRMWPRAYRQRCQVHKMRNILAKFPRLMRAKMKGLVQPVFLAPTYAAAVKRGRDLIAKFKDRTRRPWSAWSATSRSASPLCGFPRLTTNAFGRRIGSGDSTGKVAGGRKSSRDSRPSVRACPCSMPV